MNIVELKTFLNTPTFELQVNEICLNNIKNTTPNSAPGKNVVNTFLVIGIIALATIITYKYFCKEDLIKKEDKI
jgi:hypothetical protein